MTTLPQPAPFPPILVVDDDEVVLSVLRESLRTLGYELIALSDATAAVEHLERREFSVILTDQRMPGMSGLELLGHARRLRPKATRVLITAVLNLDTIVEAINQGEIFRFLVKPWLREELLATVKNSVQRYELICQNARLQEATQVMNERLRDLNRSLEEQVRVVAERNQQLATVNQGLETNFSRSLDLCVHTFERFCPALGNQSRRVSQLCRSMGSVLEFGAADSGVLVNAARLHDIGLIGVPRQIIRRWQREPERLTTQEQSLIRQHPVLGQELAAFGGGLEKVGQLIRAHHERWDGTGYPDGLSAADIPWLARLLAVAVAYASSRLAPADALDSVRMGAGTAFDPEAVRVLLRALPLAALPRRAQEIALADLRPGMILASGVYSRDGRLLFSEGQELSSSSVNSLARDDGGYPITETLAVYC
jgi:response regulator RpfG family c-di-GMP phosphodiesterase